MSGKQGTSLMETFTLSKKLSLARITQRKINVSRGRSPTLAASTVRTLFAIFRLGLRLSVTLHASKNLRTVGTNTTVSMMRSRNIWAVTRFSTMR